jgi:hypothetical protein
MLVAIVIPIKIEGRLHDMSIGLWMAATLVLGLAAMGLCVLFLKACEKI